MPLSQRATDKPKRVQQRGQRERFLPHPTRNSGFNVEERNRRDPDGCLQMWGGPRGVKTVRPMPHVLTHRAGTCAELPGAWCFSGPRLLHSWGSCMGPRRQRLDWRNSGFPPPQLPRAATDWGVTASPSRPAPSPKVLQDKSKGKYFQQHTMFDDLRIFKSRSPGQARIPISSMA